MIEAVLFDIDNTLILFDENAFFDAYLKKLVPRFSDIFTPENFRERLIGSTRALLKNQGQTSNIEYYMNHFIRDHEDRKEEIWERFQRFYSSEFNQLRDRVTVVDGTRSLLSALNKQGLKLVAASNPLWPLSIQTMRLGWADVDDLPYSMITHIENTSYCKPQPEFFLEICQSIGLKPEQCLMVGNDPLNDMIAGETGMKTYLTTDSLSRGTSSFSLSRRIRHHGNNPLPDPDFTGPLMGVITAI
jgi:FMN phosphatase YigB (HAD superfamily)